MFAGNGNLHVCTLLSIYIIYNIHMSLSLLTLTMYIFTFVKCLYDGFDPVYTSTGSVRELLHIRVCCLIHT